MEPDHFRFFDKEVWGRSFFAIRFGYTRLTTTSFFAGALAFEAVLVFFIGYFLPVSSR